LVYSGIEGVDMKIGVDCGISGAIALLNDNGSFISVHDMPVMAGTGKRQQVNASELAKIFRSMFEGGEAYVERVSAMPKQGVSSMFSFGTSYGIVLGVLAAIGIPTILVTPQSWKKRAGLTGKEKDYARTLAQQLYPAAELGRKKDIGRADALLIARFGE